MRVSSLFGVLLMAGALLVPVHAIAQGSGAGSSGTGSGGSAGGVPDQSRRAANRDADTARSHVSRGRRQAERGEGRMHRSAHRRGETRVSVSERDGWRHRHRRHAHGYVSFEERRYGHHRHGYRAVRAERDHDDCR